MRLHCEFDISVGAPDMTDAVFNNLSITIGRK